MTVILVLLTCIIFLAADALVSMYTKMYDRHKAATKHIAYSGKYALAQDGGTPYVEKETKQ